MAKDGGIIGLGIFILVISIIGYNIPSVVTEADPNTTRTIPVAVGICNSEMDQLGQAFSAEAVKICSEWSISLYGIYGVGISGVILMIVGAVIPKSSKKEEMKGINHVNIAVSDLDKSQKFYSEVFCMKEAYRIPQFRFLTCFRN